MASVEKALFEYLREDTNFTNAVGDVFWLEAPKGATAPYLVFYQIDDPNDKVFFVSYGGQARVQVNLYDTDKFKIVDNRSVVKTKLREFRESKGGISVRNVVISNDFSQTPSTDDTVYRGVVDAVIHWEDTYNGE